MVDIGSNCVSRIILFKHCPVYEHLNMGYRKRPINRDALFVGEFFIAG